MAIGCHKRLAISFVKLVPPLYRKANDWLVFQHFCIHLVLFYPARLVCENVLRIFGEDKMAIGCHKRLAISFVKLVAALYCATRLG